MMRIYDPKKILVPVDFSDMTPGVLKAAVEIGKHWGAEVKVLHVLEEVRYPAAFYAGEGSSFTPPRKLWADVQGEAESRLEAMLREVSAGPKVTGQMVWGRPADEIVRLAESEDYDLIVLATHGRKGLGRLFLGSVAGQVIRRAPCPVFVVRSKVLQESAAPKEV